MAVLYDVIVVGAGIEGSATSFQLSKRGVKVLLLEQFPLPHTRGSSHGASRITRKAYAQPFYTKMMNYCIPEWERIQQQCGQTIFKKIGFLNIGSPTDQGIKEDIASMKSNNASYEVIFPGSFRQRFPQLRYDEDVGALFDPEGGVLNADKALQTFQRLFVEQGGEIKDGEKVKDINPGEVIHVVTSVQTYRCKSLILCCGPWTNQVLKSLDLVLPLKPVKISVCYWQERVPGSYSTNQMHPFSDRRKSIVTSPYSVYGLPSDEYPGNFKLCLHHGPDVDPESRDTVDSQWVIDSIKKYVRTHFPGLVPEPSIVESCFYTNTPDKNLILDCHPKWNNIVIGAGFSGHGFKLSPAVGNILADLSQGLKPEYDMSHFKLSRFDNKPMSKL